MTPSANGSAGRARSLALLVSVSSRYVDEQLAIYNQLSVDYGIQQTYILIRSLDFGREIANTAGRTFGPCVSRDRETEVFCPQTLIGCCGPERGRLFYGALGFLRWFVKFRCGCCPLSLTINR